jgi:hypothetical protein
MKTERSNTSQKIEQIRNQLEKLFQGEKCHKQACQKNQDEKPSGQFLGLIVMSH